MTMSTECPIIQALADIFGCSRTLLRITSYRDLARKSNPVSKDELILIHQDCGTELIGMFLLK